MEISVTFNPHSLLVFPSLLLPFPPTEGAEGQMSSEEEEARRIAEMGKPILGEHSRLEVVIEESYEFKVLHQSVHIPLDEQRSLQSAVQSAGCG